MVARHLQDYKEKLSIIKTNAKKLEGTCIFIENHSHHRRTRQKVYKSIRDDKANGKKASMSMRNCIDDTFAWDDEKNMRKTSYETRQCWQHMTTLQPLHFLKENAKSG